MCGRFEQSETPRYYADALSVHISKHLKTLSDNTPSYNVAPEQRPWMIMLHNGELLFIGMPWGYRTPKEATEEKTMDMRPSREVADGKLLPTHVPRRAGDHSQWWLV